MIPKEVFLAALSIEILPESDMQEAIKVGLKDDPSLEAVLEFVTKDQSQTPASIRAKFKEYRWEDELLWYQGCIIVPDDETIKRDLASNFHDSPMARHPGQARSLELASRRYYWPGMKAWFNHYVDTCKTCQRVRAPKGDHVPVQPLPVPSKPFEHISYDMIMKLPKSSGFNSILVVIDSLTKYRHFIPCKESMNARELADLFIQDVWGLHGMPQSTVLDRGTTFNSKFLRALYKRLGIKPSFSSAYHPQTDRQTERFNQTVEHFLWAYVSHQQMDWVKWVPLAEFAYNNTKHSATGTSPFMALYAQELTMSPTAIPAGSPEADDHTTELLRIQEEVQSALHLSKERMMGVQPDTPPEFKLGEKVWLFSKNITLDWPSKKLDHHRLGPFEITEVISSTAYQLKLPKTMKVHNIIYVGLLS